MLKQRTKQLLSEIKVLDNVGFRLTWLPALSRIAETPLTSDSQSSVFVTTDSVFGFRAHVFSDPCSVCEGVTHVLLLPPSPPLSSKWLLWLYLFLQDLLDCRRSCYLNWKFSVLDNVSFRLTLTSSTIEDCSYRWARIYKCPQNKKFLISTAQSKARLTFEFVTT